MASTNVASMRLALMRKRWQDMKMMPGDFKAMKGLKNMKVAKRKQVEKMMAIKAMQRMHEGYARARSKLLFEKEAMERMSDGYAAARAKLLAKMAAEEARSSTARPSSARFATCGLGRDRRI